MGRSLNKSECLIEMERLYLLRAYSDIEMAAELGVDRTTAYRYRIELSSGDKQLPIEQDQEGRWMIERDAYLSNVRVNLFESLSLYLAARRATQQSRLAGRHAGSALEKIAVSLRQPMTKRLVKAADKVLAARIEPARVKIFETVAHGWVEQIPIRIEYRALGAEEPRQHRIHPYLIEPSPWSDSVYVIAHSEASKTIIPFKIERIEQAVLSTGRFEIPKDFNEDEMLRHAWGIWAQSGTPQTVRLKFAAGAAARRLQESTWHPLEKVTIEADESCIWEAPIAEWREMLPWIRGWGADCEVLEPEELRRALEKEARGLAELYQVMEKKVQMIAHIRKKDKELQLLTDHLTAVSILAGQFADKIGLKEVGEILGLLHDFGKASDKFQKYILSGEGLIDPDAEEYLDPISHKGKIDHTTAGAQVIYEHLWNKGQKEQITAQVLSLCIASHHSGLINCLTPDGENDFQRRMEKADESTRKNEALSHLQEIEIKVKELLSDNVINKIIEKLQSLQEGSKTTSVFKSGLLIRFLLSCLLDADRLDTADFETPGNLRIRNYGQYQPWSVLVARLEKKFDEFAQKTSQINAGKEFEVNLLRAQVAQACLDFAVKPKGIYQLTVPTGGGKTLSSLRFALNHAANHGMDRVFYVIPFTSIIDQNADEIRKILEDRDKKDTYLDKVVLEHHSNLTPEEESRRHNLLAENWDAPVVLTTQVHFLEALFGSGTRNARRMHQLANSVIILDEIQAVPINMIHMLNVAVRFLVHNCGATVVLCTATQPPLHNLPDNPYRELTVNQEQKIIQNEQELFEKLKRVEVFDERKIGGWTEEEVAELTERQLQEKGSVLIVVNTKNSARVLHQEIAENSKTSLYHLSTNMCPAHRLDALNTIKEKLELEEPIICVSTQLIEAGVDIDFGAVIRYLAGLDSIAQSAGRCNRHGKRQEPGNVWIVNPKNENIDRLKDIVIGREQSLRFLDDFRGNPEQFGNERIGLDAMATYYKWYYARRGDEMTYKVGTASSVGRNDDLFNLLSTNTESANAYARTHNNAYPPLAFMQSFRTAAKEFRVIDSPTQGIVVPYIDGNEIIKDLCAAPELDKQYKLIKKAQRYSVNLFPHEFNQLFEAGIIREVQKGAGIFYLDDQYYSDDFGWSKEPVNEMKTHIL